MRYTNTWRPFFLASASHDNMAMLRSGPKGRLLIADCGLDDVWPIGQVALTCSAQLCVGTCGDWVGSFDKHRAAVWDVSMNADATRVKRSATALAVFS